MAQISDVDLQEKPKKDKEGFLKLSKAAVYGTLSSLVNDSNLVSEKFAKAVTGYIWYIAM